MEGSGGGNAIIIGVRKCCVIRVRERLVGVSRGLFTGHSCAALHVYERIPLMGNHRRSYIPSDVIMAEESPTIRPATSYPYSPLNSYLSLLLLTFSVIA